ncbi:hypothetical protein [Streptomyces sp. NRRL S-378]|uniref:hypothetical protein n=1 Tax=Streptomyces sp. NRRL S-378 TaxID=1463904 RepID=UPI0004C81F8F|nr:hypothetical protein [Streptomyces sp. NRRL S-378]
MHYDLIAAGRAVALSRPTTPTAEGTVMLPLVGSPVTGRIRLAWNRSVLSAGQAQQLCGAAARAYLADVDNNRFHRAGCGGAAGGVSSSGGRSAAGTPTP